MSKKDSVSKKERVVNVTRKMQNDMRARGINEEAIPSEGKHRFKRVSPDRVAKRRESKIKITMFLDADVLHYFRQRAGTPNAAPYQTQINNELRRIMESEMETNLNNTARALLEDEKFINELKKRLAA
jgi:uncharacterized protein (DUF4415 family)